MKRTRCPAILLLLIASVAGEAGAQVASPTARSGGVANSFTARARGYEAPFWNPANLGLSERPRLSLGLAGVSGYLNNNSLSYSQISDLYGVFLDDQAKSDLLAEIRKDNPDRLFELDFDLGGSVLGISIGRFAAGLSMIAAGNMKLTPDAFELVLFGNDGEDGSGADLDLEGTDGKAWWMTGAYLAYAQPFTISALDHLGMRFSVGAGVNFGVTNGYIRVADRGSRFTQEPLALAAEAEIIRSTDADAGRYWGIDLGLAMEWQKLVAGISLQNALGNVDWNVDDFEFHFYVVQSDFDGTSTTDRTFAFSDLSREEQDRLRGLLAQSDPPKRLRLGAMYQVTPKLSLSADYRDLIGGTLRSRWDHTLSAGGEFIPLEAFPLRAGLATDFSQLAVTAGIGAYLKAIHIDLAIGDWILLEGDGIVASLSISLWPTDWE